MTALHQQWQVSGEAPEIVVVEVTFHVISLWFFGVSVTNDVG